MLKTCDLGPNVFASVAKTARAVGSAGDHGAPATQTLDIC